VIVDPLPLPLLQWARKVLHGDVNGAGDPILKGESRLLRAGVPGQVGAPPVGASKQVGARNVLGHVGGLFEAEPGRGSNALSRVADCVRGGSNVERHEQCCA
jgi:hypothetical protein